jgi:peptide methionine sulfoxide reductase msrA/msrB
VYTDEELREKLTPLQYKVTQEGGTEPPFNNLYWDNKEDGIYVDVIDGTALFSSTDKFESGTGWPAFTKPIDENFIEEETDDSLFMERVEIKAGNNHLGHVFEDGPEGEGGLRYCINSAALNFIPKDELVARGYSKYMSLFEE